MAQITKEQIKRVYALASGLGILESNNKNDMLHQLVFSVTGKESVSKLTDTEFKKLQGELIERMKLSNLEAPLKTKKDKPKAKAPEDVPDMMTQAQQNLAWRMIYRLQELDETESSATVGDRIVITSYSIHYTKLYDVVPVSSYQERLQVLLLLACPFLF